MPCFRPLTAWRGEFLPSGKRSVVFKAGESAPGLSAFPQKLPCGQCIGCRLDYSLDWATRCLHEASLHRRNCFITLTYDPVHLPKDGGLVLSDWQDFMKRLRKFVHPAKIRFFHAGEYGELFGRPHYHALIFGYDFDDRVPFKKTGSGEIICSSKTLDKVWGKGYTSVGDVTFESAAYVARYCLKKISGKAKEVVDARGLTPYERLDESNGVVTSLRPEYVTMSRRPGIAFEWFQKFKKDVYPHDYVVVRGGVKMPPPRYFDGLYELENPLDMRTIKLQRLSRCTKKVEDWNDLLRKFQTIDDNCDRRLAVKEEVKKAEISRLSKKLERERI